MLRHFGVEPYMVFDGSPLPTKEGTHIERRLKREKAREAATDLLRKGNRKLAWKEFMKAAAVTPEMAKSVMVELDRKHVKYVVAPYEADPQMVYLEKVGLVDGILSEDSDLLVFGCRKLITKLNDYGECIEIDRANLAKLKRLPFLATFTHAQWRLIAILSGCDYTKGIPGVGLKTAFTMVQRLGSLDKIVASLKADGKVVPDDFMEEAFRADLAFQYQKVFDPIKRELLTLTNYTDGFDIDMEIVEMCCGRTLNSDVHAGICTGKVHPETHGPLISREQNLAVRKSNSMVSQRPAVTKTAVKSQSFGPSKSIESYFKVDSAVKIVRNTLDVDSAKRLSDCSTKLSPTSKKLRSIATLQVSSGGSRFFASKTPVFTPNIPVLAPNLSPGHDSSFLTGDSEIPESSSPVKCDSFNLTAAAGAAGEETKDSQYLTDTDDDFSQGSLTQSMIGPPGLVSAKSIVDENSSEDGYQNELDESPVKRQTLSRQWREKFLMKTRVSTEKVTVREVKLTVVTQVAQVTRDDTDGSLSPHTPSSSGEITFAGSESQLKSLQREEYVLSESEEEMVSVVAPPSTTLKLLRFAFTQH